MASCEMLPNTLRRSNQAKKQFLRFLLQSAITDCRVNVCSWQPSKGLALFCCDECKLLLMAKFETRINKMDVNNLYKQDINAIGLKLLGSSPGFFLRMRMVVEFRFPRRWDPTFTKTLVEDGTKNFTVWANKF